MIRHVLAANPVVHFDKSVTDSAGQTGVGFYSVADGFRGEIMIDPSTYVYLGSESFAIRSQTWRRTVDGHTVTSVIKKGLYGWSDLVATGIVHHPGQKP